MRSRSGAEVQAAVRGIGAIRRKEVDMTDADLARDLGAVRITVQEHHPAGGHEKGKEISYIARKMGQSFSVKGAFLGDAPHGEAGDYLLQHAPTLRHGSLGDKTIVTASDPRYAGIERAYEAAKLGAWLLRSD